MEEQSGQIVAMQARRDCKPHRGYDLLFLARVALVFGVLALITCLTALVAIPLGMVVVYFAEKDMDAMDVGEMDSRGRAETKAASRLGGLAALWGFAGAAILAGLFVSCAHM